jgi:hypothetical protein
MDSKNENQYIKYYSEIKYKYSTFKLDLNLEKDDNLKISLIYADELEYSSIFKFTSLKIKYHKCKSINEFFIFLNEYEKDYQFYISEIKIEYCNLTIQFLDNIFNENNFKLLNKNSNKDIESIKRNKLLSHNVDELIEKCKKSGSIILDDISFQKGENGYIFNLNHYSYIIFISKIKVIINIEDEENKKIEKEIRTNNDIYELLEENYIDKNNVFLGKFKLEQVINGINNYITNNILTLRVIIKKIPETNWRKSNEKKY